LILLCRTLFVMWATSTLNKCFNICVMSSTCFMVGLWNPLVCRVIDTRKTWVLAASRLLNFGRGYKELYP
jgi:hypothetical protein